MVTFCECSTCNEIQEKINDRTPKHQKTAEKLYDETPFEKSNYEYYLLEVAGGKYSVYQPKSGSLRALRYGEPWRILTGDNLIFNLMAELIEAKEKIQRALKTIHEADYVDENLTKILKGQE